MCMSFSMQLIALWVRPQGWLGQDLIQTSPTHPIPSILDSLKNKNMRHVKLPCIYKISNLYLMSTVSVRDGQSKPFGYPSLLAKTCLAVCFTAFSCPKTLASNTDVHRVSCLLIHLCQLTHAYLSVLLHSYGLRHIVQQY